MNWQASFRAALDLLSTEAARTICMIVLLVLLVLFPAVGMFVLPAALLWVLGGFRSLDRFTRAIYCIFFGISCWTWLPWLTRYVPISLSSLIWVVMLALAGILVFLAMSRKRQPRQPTRRLGKSACLLLAVLTAAIVLARLLPAISPNAPPGADPSMHTYNARLIIDSDSIPRTHRPLLPIDSFGEYPIGFSTLAACSSLMGGMEVQNSTLIWTGLTYVLLTFGLFLLLRVWFTQAISLVTAAAATSLARVPQDYCEWGGNPTVLSLALVLAAFAALFSLKQNHRLPDLFAQASLWAAALLIHAIPFLAAAYFLLAFGLCLLVRAVILRRAQELKACAAQCAWVLLIALLLVTPFLAGYSVNVSPKEIEWVKWWQRDADHVWHGSIHNCLWTIPLYVARVFRYHIVGFAVLGLFFSIFSWRRRMWIMLSSVVFLLLILNSQYWVLPFSYALYPERMAAMLIAPIALLLGGLLVKMRRLHSRAISVLKAQPSASLGQRLPRILPVVCAALAAAAVTVRMVANLTVPGSVGFRFLRVALFLGVFAVLLFELLSFGRDRKLVKAACGLSAVLVLFCILIGYSCINLHGYYIGPMVSNSGVAQADLNAFEWIKQNTAKTDIILNVPEHDYSGLWIPALCGRRIRRPHSNPFYFDELQKGNEGAATAYAFIGSRPHANSEVHPTVEAIRYSLTWLKVASFGQAEVYERYFVGPGRPPLKLVGPKVGE
ncbi:MAG TPA: hypothetical protein VM163_10940 [bacterium]|nr:hypothetical protein [bacterium]